MKQVVVFKFEVFDESIKQIAKEAASEFPGVTKVVDVEGEGQIEVWGDFSTFELTKELMKIDESVEAIKIVQDGVTEPEVKIQQQDVASRSMWRVPAYELLEQAKGVAEQAKVMGVGAAGKAIAIGVEYYQNKNKEKEIIKPKPQPKKGEDKPWGQFPRAEKRELFNFRKGKLPVEYRLHDEWSEEGGMKQKMWPEENKVLQEKMRKQGLAKKGKEIKQKKILPEENMILQEIMRKHALAMKEQEKKQKKIREEQEKVRKQGFEKNSGGATGYWWNNTPTLSMGQTSASTQTQRSGHTSASMEAQRSGQPSTFTQTQRSGQTSGFTQTLRSGQTSGFTQTQRSGQTSAFTQTQRSGQTSASTSQDQDSAQTRKKDSRAVEKKGKNGN